MGFGLSFSAIEDIIKVTDFKSDVANIVLLVNKIFELIDSLDPGFKNQLSLEEIETKAEETVLED